MQPKQPFFPNVKACTKSLHHKDFLHAMIFGWFGDALLLLSVQKLAILADLYQLSANHIIGLVKKNAHTKSTQNTLTAAKPK
jgi:hypothetical protein